MQNRFKMKCNRFYNSKVEAIVILLCLNPKLFILPDKYQNLNL
jgi:hypothetical protein